jgi:hypothetical protein
MKTTALRSCYLSLELHCESAIFGSQNENGGKKLREVIQEAADPDLIIARDDTSPAYVAVTTAASREIVEGYIRRRNQAKSVIPDLSSLPRSVVLAFCVRQENGKSVFLHKSFPFKYEIADPTADRDQFILIDDRYRRPGLKIGDASELSPADRLDLQTKIAAWARDNGVKLEDFYATQENKPTNALERLIAAQPRGLAERIMIPADIALILTKHE